MNNKTERIELRLDPEILERIDEWRRDQAGIPNRSAAARQLIEAGLGRPEDDRLFQMARFSVLIAAMTKSSKTALSDAYVFAWESGVYPAFHESTQLHKPFADQFLITRDEVSTIGKYLDSRWLKKDVPTFYELEDKHDVRSGQTNWDRSKLIDACRYMYLKGMFDAPFWSTILSKSPAEAQTITYEFSAAENIYIG